MVPKMSYLMRFSYNIAGKELKVKASYLSNTINKIIMEVKERVIEVLSDKLGINKLEIKETQDIMNDLGCDSLDMAEIIMGIEEEFDLKIDDTEISEVKTVGDLIKKVEDKRLGR